MLHLFLFLHEVPFTYQLKTIEKNIKQLDYLLSISITRWKSRANNPIVLV